MDPVLAHNHCQLPHELRLKAEASHPASIPIQGKNPVRHEAHAQPQRDEIHNDIKAVQLHGRLDGQSLRLKPRPQRAPGFASVIDEQPTLRQQSLAQRFQRRLSTGFGHRMIRRRHEDELVFKPVRDGQGLG